MDLRLPSYDAGTRSPVEPVLKSILDFDQFDDWLTDPVYYNDHKQAGSAALNRVEDIWKSGSIKDSKAESLMLPRTSGKSVPAMALSFETRVAAQTVIASIAARINARLPRDKVCGFEYKSNAYPVFSAPGEGLGQAYANALEAAWEESTDYVGILDVTAFNASARMAELSRVLEKLGAKRDETEFLTQVIVAREQGLPSIDDSFAYLYNYYLQPVDQKLCDSQVNFFRYRDEYFILDKTKQSQVETALRELQLTAILVRTYFPSEIRDQLQDKAYDEDNSEVSKEIDNVDDGLLIGNYLCHDWSRKPKGCNSDAYELRFSFEAIAKPHLALVKLQSANLPHDALRVLPLLRGINRLRQSGVRLQPPFTGATPEFLEYAKELTQHRNWFVAALQTALQTKSDWQVVWAAPLLSDAGYLTPAEVTLLSRIVASNLGPVAKTQARLALARSSRDPAASSWAEPSQEASDYQIRASLLAARYLHKRGIAGPWQTMEQRTSGAELELKKYLS